MSEWECCANGEETFYMIMTSMKNDVCNPEICYLLQYLIWFEYNLAFNPPNCLRPETTKNNAWNYKFMLGIEQVNCLRTKQP